MEPRLNLLTSQWNRLEHTSEVDSITEVFHIYELCPPQSEIKLSFQTRLYLVIIYQEQVDPSLKNDVKMTES